MSISQNELYQEYYRLLYPIALNMLRHPADAEDMVQETLLKWWSMGEKKVENPKGYLVKSLINRCLNFIRDHRKNQSQIEIAPELLVDHLPQLIEKGPSLSLSFLMMLEKLNPVERAVFLLKEVFYYSHKEISELLGISEENSRQILVRAKRYLKADKNRFEVEQEEHLALYEAFIRVCQGETMNPLLEKLREDIEIYVNDIPATQLGTTPTAVLTNLASLPQQAAHLLRMPSTPMYVPPYMLLYLKNELRFWVRLVVKFGNISQLRIYTAKPEFVQPLLNPMQICA